MALGPPKKTYVEVRMCEDYAWKEQLERTLLPYRTLTPWEFLQPLGGFNQYFDLRLRSILTHCLE